MSERSNSARIIEELVSLEAWYKPLVPDEKSPFHIALAFGDARYAGGDKLPVEFKVRLKRATLVVVCDTELSVPKASKVRVYPSMEKTVRSSSSFGEDSESSKSSTAQFRAGADATTSPSAGAGMGRNRSSTARESRENQIETSEVLTQHIRMTHRAFRDEDHWDCEPLVGSTLMGSAHDGSTPILEIRPKIDRRLQDLGVRVFLKCKAEDFEITDVNATKTVKERLFGKGLERRLRMAREVIREKLAEAQLDVVELDPKFREVIIADVLAVPDGD